MQLLICSFHLTFNNMIICTWLLCSPLIRTQNKRPPALLFRSHQFFNALFTFRRYRSRKPAPKSSPKINFRSFADVLRGDCRPGKLGREKRLRRQMPSTNSFKFISKQIAHTWKMTFPLFFIAILRYKSQTFFMSILNGDGFSSPVIPPTGADPFPSATS